MMVALMMLMARAPYGLDGQHEKRPHQNMNLHAQGQAIDESVYMYMYMDMYM